MSSGLGVETLISQAQSRDNNEASESGCDHATLQVDDMLGSEQVIPIWWAQYLSCST